MGPSNIHRIAVIASLCAVSCFKAPDFPSGVLGCSEEGRCPEGQFCAPDNLCYDNGDGPDADASIDAVMPDAPSNVAFQVACIAQIATNQPELIENEWVRLVNTSDGPIDLSSVEVVDVSSSDSRFRFVASWTGPDLELPIGMSAGRIQEGGDEFVETVSKEPVFDQTIGLVALSAAERPNLGDWTSVDVEVTVRLAGSIAVVPLRWFSNPNVDGNHAFDAVVVDAEPTN